MKTIRLSPWMVLLTVGTTWSALAACGSDAKDSTFDHASVDSGSGGPPELGFSNPDAAPATYADFPAGALIDAPTDDAGVSTSAPVPANAADLFASAAAPAVDGGSGSSPCLVEPEVGSLFPRNWLRPRFRWSGAGDANIFEIRVHAANQTNDLVVYTTSPQWIMPKQMWTSFASHSAGLEITLSVRGGKLANGAITGLSQGSQGAWGIAPVDAPGSIVYWHIIDDNNADLKGFQVGDESVGIALSPGDVQPKTRLKCVGCHTSTPDGLNALFASKEIVSTGGIKYGLGVASIKADTIGQKPSYVSSFGQNALEQSVWGISTTSAAFWGPGQHLVVSSDENGHLVWVNLDATDARSAMGTVALTGEKRARSNSPSLSHDGTRLAYISGDDQADGRPKGANNDIAVVPFNGGAGGTSTLLAGASTTANEYYPTFSPDDKLVAFTKTEQSGEDAYAAEHAEIFVVDANGGAAQRLAANDPPACSGVKSPGVENSWPKWAPKNPAGSTVGGNTYYWLVFSSTRLTPERNGQTKRQLFMAPVVVDGTGKVTQYKAVYLWNQPANEKNHTPAWDVFAIPSAGGLK